MSLYVVFCFVSDVGAGCARGHMPLLVLEKKVVIDVLLAWKPNIIIKTIWSQNAFVKFINYFCFCLSVLKSYYTPTPTFLSSPEVCPYHTVHFQWLSPPLSGPLTKPLPLLHLHVLLKACTPTFWSTPTPLFVSNQKQFSEKWQIRWCWKWLFDLIFESVPFIICNNFWLIAR